MVPILDLINHGNQPNSDYKFMPNGDVILTAQRDLKLGEEVTFHYTRSRCKEWFYSFFGYHENFAKCTEVSIEPDHRKIALSKIIKQIKGVGSNISERPRYWETDERERWSRGLLDSAAT